MERTSHIKKFLSAFFAFVLAFSLVPSAAWATSTIEDSSTQETTSESGTSESSSATEEATDGTVDESTAEEPTTDDSASDTTSVEETTSDSLLEASAINTTSTDEEISLASTSEANPDTSTWTAVHSYEDFYNATNLTEGQTAYVKLYTGITKAEVLELPENSTLYLDLNGHTFTRQTQYSVYTPKGSVIRLNTGAKLYLYDTSDSHEGSLKGGRSYYGGGIYVGEKAAVHLYGCAITGNGGESGAGVYVDSNGYLYVHDDTTISNNICGSGGGGGVYLDTDAHLVIDGGDISNNSAYHDTYSRSGGGVYGKSGSTVTIAGGSIYNNKASEEAGGIYLDSGTTLTMTGGSIHSNTASENGGGIYSEGTVNISGGEIYGNKVTGSKYSGGGIFGGSSSSITISGGSIYNNEAASSGGGVYGRMVTMTGGSIYGNTATYGGGISYDVEQSQTNTSNYHIVLNGGSITGNTASIAGSGVAAGCQVDVYNTTITGNTCTGYTNGVKPAGAFCATYPRFHASTTSTIKINGNTGGDYVRNTLSGITSNSSVLYFYGDPTPETNNNISIALTLSPGETYQKLVTISNQSQAGFFTASDSDSSYMGSTDNGYWLWVYDTKQGGTNVTIDSVIVTDGTNGAFILGSELDSATEWKIPSIFDDVTNLQVIVRYTEVKYTGTGVATTFTSFEDNQTNVDLSSSKTYTHSVTGTDGTFARSITLSTTAATSGTVSSPKGIGGALRMDTAASTDETTGTTTYYTADTSLRFGFNFQLPTGAEISTFGWNYGTSADKLSYSIEGTNYREAGSLSTDDKDLTGYISNLVFTGVDAAHYASTIYAQMYVVYTLNGATITEYTDIQSRSVSTVYGEIQATGSGATDEEIAYAKALEAAYKATQSTTEESTEGTTEETGTESQAA